MRGNLIVLEGPDRCGKTTQSLRLSAWLSSIQSNFAVIRKQEPGSTSIGKEIRELLLNPVLDIDPLTQVFLFCAARSALCQQIERDLEEGHWVICDRFSPSTHAYQGAGHGVPEKSIAVLDAVARGAEVTGDAWFQSYSGGLVPDLTIILDLPFSQYWERADSGDPFEGQGVDFKDRVWNVYKGVSGAHIDGTGTEDEVFGRIQKAVNDRFFSKTKETK